MNGNSSTSPAQIENLGNDQYQIRWNVHRNDRATMPEAIPIESYDFQYNTKYLAQSVCKKEIMLAIIREKYDVADEISLSMKRDDDAVKLQEHEEYVISARGIAEQIMVAYETV